MSARNAQPQLELRDPADLRPHPLKKLLPKSAPWQKGGDEFNRLLEDIRERGIVTPLTVDATGQILDGEICWLVAKQLHLPEVPVIVNAAEPASVIIGSLIHRRHLTKSALAYVCYPLFAHAHQEAVRRHHARLRTGNQTISHSVGYAPRLNSPLELAEQIGVSRTFFDYASRLHTLFTKTPTLRAEWEPKILAGEVALGAALAGIAGGATGGARIGDQLLLFTSGFDTITKRFGYWQKFDEVTKEAARKTIHETVAAMPEDLREEFETAIRRANKPQSRRDAERGAA